ncbi:hypothetical protein DFH27DRAFT_545837, partial [Peziza echinospora]
MSNRKSQTYNSLNKYFKRKSSPQSSRPGPSRSACLDGAPLPQAIPPTMPPTRYKSSSAEANPDEELIWVNEKVFREAFAEVFRMCPGATVEQVYEQLLVTKPQFEGEQAIELLQKDGNRAASPQLAQGPAQESPKSQKKQVRRWSPSADASTRRQKSPIPLIAKSKSVQTKLSMPQPRADSASKSQNKALTTGAKPTRRPRLVRNAQSTADTSLPKQPIEQPIFIPDDEQERGLGARVIPKNGGNASFESLPRQATPASLHSPTSDSDAAKRDSVVSVKKYTLPPPPPPPSQTVPLPQLRGSLNEATLPSNSPNPVPRAQEFQPTADEVRLNIRNINSDSTLSALNSDQIQEPGLGSQAMGNGPVEVLVTVPAPHSPNTVEPNRRSQRIKGKKEHAQSNNRKRASNGATTTSKKARKS